MTRPPTPGSQVQAALKGKPALGAQTHMSYTSSRMTDVKHRRSRSALWIGLLITLLGALSNGLYLVNPPAQVLLPWINLLVPIVGLIVVGIGIWRALVRSQAYGGKILGPALAAICIVLVGGSTFLFVHARDIPTSSAASRVGQKAPAFTLQDSDGKAVSLSELFSSPGPDSGSPKAVLLIFYRGHW